MYKNMHFSIIHVALRCISGLNTIALLCMSYVYLLQQLGIQFPNVADLAAQLGHFSCVSCHKHLDKKEQFPAAVISGRWRGRVDTHDNKGSALVRVCPIWPRLLQLSFITNKKN